VIGLISVHIASTYLFFQTGILWRCLYLVPPPSATSIWDVIWLIIMNDMMVRFASMIIKSLLIMVLVDYPHKRRGQLFNFIEDLSHLYRIALPVPIWFIYFLHEENGQLFSCMIGGMYLTLKLTSFFAKVRHLLSIFKAFVIKEVPFGTYATTEEIGKAGDLCAICQEKMKSPVKLSCTHVFCEDCVSEWFEREKTCPLCRASIRCAGNKTHSDGSTNLLVQLF